MRFHCYSGPSRSLLIFLFALKAKARWLRFPAALILVLVWLFVMPLAWVLIKLGDVGHAMAGFCGFDSRSW